MRRVYQAARGIGGGSEGAVMNWELKFVDVLATGNDRLTLTAITAGLTRGTAIDAGSISPIPAPGAAAVLLGAVVLGARPRR
ncbi:MAG: hypothetical protein ACKVS8_03575 [Phycisphaerales bacterium]